MPRILLASVVGLLGFALYVSAAVTLADSLAEGHWAVRALYFAVAGLLWVLPARSLMLWAARR